MTRRELDAALQPLIQAAWVAGQAESRAVKAQNKKGASDPATKFAWSRFYSAKSELTKIRSDLVKKLAELTPEDSQ